MAKFVLITKASGVEENKQRYVNLETISEFIPDSEELKTTIIFISPGSEWLHIEETMEELIALINKVPSTII